MRDEGKVTAAQANILKHAVAWHTRTRKVGEWPWRNHYATGPDCDNWGDVKELERLGLMNRILPAREGGIHSLDIFRVSKEGIEWLKEHEA